MPTGAAAGAWLLLNLLVAARAAGGPPGRAVVWCATAGLLAGAVLAPRFRRPERDHPGWWDTVAPPAPRP
jgi:membrane associated rhomboid family serine protease